VGRRIPLLIVRSPWHSYLQRGTNIKAFPDGFRMIAGNPMLRSYTNTLEQQAVSFVCLAYSQGKNYPELPYVRAHRSTTA
jgi:hypothetical protein